MMRLKKKFFFEKHGIIVCKTENSGEGQSVVLQLLRLNYFEKIKLVGMS